MLQISASSLVKSKSNSNVRRWLAVRRPPFLAIRAATAWICFQFTLSACQGLGGAGGGQGRRGIGARGKGNGLARGKVSNHLKGCRVAPPPLELVNLVELRNINLEGPVVINIV